MQNGYQRHRLSLFLISLFLSYQVALTLFTHSHTINGTRIAHSHFYAGKTTDGTPVHQHSANEITIIAFVSSFTTTLAAVFSIPACYFQFVTLCRFKGETSGPFKRIVSALHLRAPPSLRLHTSMFV